MAMIAKAAVIALAMAVAQIVVIAPVQWSVDRIVMAVVLVAAAVVPELAV